MISQDLLLISIRKLKPVLCLTFPVWRAMLKQFTADLKWQIIYLHNEGFLRRMISRYLYVSVPMVGMVLRIFDKWGSVGSPFKGETGRRRRFSLQNMEVIAVCTNGEMYSNLLRDLFNFQVLQQLVREKFDWYLDELVEEMEKRTGKCVSVSVPMLWHSLAFCGISGKRVFSS